MNEWKSVFVYSCACGVNSQVSSVWERERMREKERMILQQNEFTHFGFKCKVASVSTHLP